MKKKIEKIYPEIELDTHALKTRSLCACVCVGRSFIHSFIYPSFNSIQLNSCIYAHPFNQWKKNNIHQAWSTYQIDQIRSNTHEYRHRQTCVLFTQNDKL